MTELSYTYVIIGGGLSGAASVEGIRDVRESGSILVLGAEHDMPYDRPPLSKQLWTGGKSAAEVFLHPEDFYKKRGVELRLGVEVKRIDVERHTVEDARAIRTAMSSCCWRPGRRPGCDQLLPHLVRLPAFARGRCRRQVGDRCRRRFHRRGDGGRALR